MFFVVVSLPEGGTAIRVDFGSNVVLIQVLAFVRPIVLMLFQVMLNKNIVGGEFVDVALLAAESE